jgi:hypothetical protein
MAEQGVLMTTMAWGANLTETAMAIPVGTARAIRDEIFRATYAGVDMVEGFNQSSFKVLREMIKRMDRFSQEGINGLDALAGSLARVIRGSGEAAGEMVSKTAASLAGSNEPPSKQLVVPSA